MPKLDLETIPQTNATGYPPHYADVIQGRWYRRLAPAAGIEDFGASHVVLQPGAWSSQRHWHAGDIAAFPKNDGNGHVLQNRSDAPCVYVAIGRPSATDCHYPDIDMHLFAGIEGQRRKDGGAF